MDGLAQSCLLLEFWTMEALGRGNEREHSQFDEDTLTAFSELGIASRKDRGGRQERKD